MRRERGRNVTRGKLNSYEGNHRTTVGQHCARILVFFNVFLYFTEVQKCYVFRHCAGLFVYLCISRKVIFSGTVPDYLFIYVFPEMLCFQALCQIICLFMYFYFSRSPEMLYFQALSQIICLFMYFYFSRSPEMLCFQALFHVICLLMYFYFSRSPEMLCFLALCHIILFIYLFINLLIN